MPKIEARGSFSLTEFLATHAQPKQVNSNMSLQSYYGSVDLVLRQAGTYRSSGNEEQLYVFLLRFVSLMLETIPKHKLFSKSDARYMQLKKTLIEKIFPELEVLKLNLNTRMVLQEQRTRHRPTDVVRLTTSDLPQLDWAATPRAPHAFQAPDLRVEDLMDILALGSQGGQAASSVSIPSALKEDLPEYKPRYVTSKEGENKHALFYPSDSSGQSQPTSSGRQSRPAPSFLPSPYQALSTSISAAAIAPSPTSAPLRPSDVLSTFAANQHLTQSSQQHFQPHPSAGPSLGPQEIGVLCYPPSHQGVPGSCSDPLPSAPGPAPPMDEDMMVVSQPQSSPSPTQTGPKELSKRPGLRDVHVSVALMEEFLRFAASNTSRNIETCGILAGKLSGNDSVFTITTLIVPKQRGTTDTVEMLNEEDILTVHLERELYPLGWIHTHPSQTCFLSSVDVHTQCSYQTMLDEAVAIVMAPTDRTKKCGIFRLTSSEEGGGLQLVQKCERRGFHTHSATNSGQELYELCGHVFLNPRVQHEVVDLRN